jgi:hypothetical protein
MKLTDEQMMQATINLPETTRRSVLRMAWFDNRVKETARHPMTVGAMYYKGKPSDEKFPSRVELVEAMVSTGLWSREKAEKRVPAKYDKEMAKETVVAELEQETVTVPLDSEEAEEALDAMDAMAADSFAMAVTGKMTAAA